MGNIAPGKVVAVGVGVSVGVIVGVTVSVGVKVAVGVIVLVTVAVIVVLLIGDVGGARIKSGGCGVRTGSEVPGVCSEVIGGGAEGVNSLCCTKVFIWTSGISPSKSHKKADPISIVSEYLAKSIDVS